MNPISGSDQGSPNTPLHAPPVVYLPVRLDDAGDAADVAMIKLSDGRVALLAYTALDRLIDACGEEQPWMLAATESLESLHAEKPYDLRLLDVTVPESFRPLLRGES